MTSNEASADADADPALRALLDQVQRGEVSVDQCLTQLRQLPFEDLGFARFDHHRALRTGAPEVIFGQGKTADEVATLMHRAAQRQDQVLTTRADAAQYEATRRVLSEAHYDERCGLLWIDAAPQRDKLTGAMVVAAGTSDAPVAEEAAKTLELMGHAPQRLIDLGVAGLHRLLPHLAELQQAKVIVTVAGMEGALPSVIAGLVRAPVIAVPTSVGYGASFEGLAALLGMLSSCAAGLSVVNIDNGFGAGQLAATINRLAHAAPTTE
jgi:NCAIR mutase (PurE)-related protein